MSSSRSRRQSVTFVDDPELQVQRSSSTKLLASIASSGRPSPFQQMADNQQPDPHPFSSSSLSAMEQESHPQRPSDSQISIWPWRRHIRRPARKSESSLNLSCQEKRELTQPELSVGNKDAADATPRTGQQPAHLPHTLKMGQHPAQHPPNLTEGLRRPSSNAQCPQELTRPSSQTQAAAVEWGSVQQQPMPGAQHVQADEGRPHPELRFPGLTEKRPCVKTRNCWLHPEQAAVEDTVQQLPTPFQRASSKQVDGSLDGADAPRVAWQARQLRAPPKKSTSFSVSSPLSPGRPLSDDGVQRLQGSVLHIVCTPVGVRHHYSICMACPPFR
ncbi:hypothetical protein DUNSADRAFT_317 [Dunaliella salina]|uniref:Encoded protein n=1 Tax=Dunaliella salina TaxID=3046 RepID=A0ABQ7FZ67_DUNSA|nr:hypothetical protein DUNSADRAFT_317 [Dunaliella salina]|eukprot:KAF5827644.1 hypothetical protein DUNSADRAFT_317 [Dunaliella salina]